MSLDLLRKLWRRIFPLREAPDRPPYAPMAWKYGMGPDDLTRLECENGHRALLTAYHDQHADSPPCKQCGKLMSVVGFEKKQSPEVRFP